MPSRTTGSRSQDLPETVIGIDQRSEATQVGDELVAIAPVDGAHVLDDLAALRVRRTLELERRRVQRDAESLRFLLVGHRRLDSLPSADDRDLEAPFEDLVERAALQV